MKGLTFEAIDHGVALYTRFTGSVRVLGSVILSGQTFGHIEQRLADENIGHEIVLTDVEFPERVVYEEDVEYRLPIEFISYTRQ